MAITLLDGLVLARSAFHHLFNYRSVVLFGHGHAVEADEEKLRALECITEHVAAGRWAEVRKPSPGELHATNIVALPIETASAKVRSGPPKDDEDDYALNMWAGVIPIRQQALEPIPDPRLQPDVLVPAYLSRADQDKEDAS